jgi:hypothetical protein
MGLIGTAGGLPSWVAVALIVTGVVVYTVGEIWQAAGAFELRYNLVPAHAQGQYSRVSLLGGNLTGAVAPSVVGLFCVSWGMPGWWLLGGALVIVGLAIPFVVRWAERTPPAGMAP